MFSYFEPNFIEKNSFEKVFFTNFGENQDDAN